MNKRLLIIAFLCCIPWCLSAQKFGVKTNLLYDATTTMNLGVELKTGKRTTIELPVSLNPWTFSDNKKFKHLLVQPEFRWWFCESFNGSFLGVHVHGARFNAGGVGPFKTIEENRYEGWLYGGGVSYGHNWILSNRWGFELELGVGYARMEYDKYGCGKCEPKIKTGHYNYFGPTRLQASIVFMLW